MANVRSTAMAQILSHLATNPGASSAQIERATGRGPASLFPALAALEYDKLIVAGWEDGPSPRRRLYTLTPAGRQKVGEMPPAVSAAPVGWGNRLWQKFIAPLFGG